MLSGYIDGKLEGDNFYSVEMLKCSLGKGWSDFLLGVWKILRLEIIIGNMQIGKRCW